MSIQATRLTTLWAEALGKKFDPFRLKQEHGSIYLDIDDDGQRIYHKLSSVAASADILLLIKILSRQSIEAVLSDIASPLLVLVMSSPWKLYLFRPGTSRAEGQVTVFCCDREEEYLTVREALAQLPDTDLMVLAGSELDPLVGSSLHERGSQVAPHTLRRLFNLLSTERREIGFIYTYAIVIGLLSLVLPLGVQSIINLISGGLILQPVVVLIIMVILAIIATGVIQIFQMSMVERLQQRVFARAAFEFGFRIPRLRLESLAKYYPPELMNRFFDVLTVQKGLAKLLMDFITAILQLTFGLILLCFYHPFFIGMAFGLVGVLYLLFMITGPRGLKTSLEESKYKYRVVHWLEELARALPSFKLAGFTMLPLEKLDQYSTGYLKKRKEHFSVLVTQFSALIVLKTLVVGGLLILGSLLVIDRQITLGQFVASEIVVITVMAAIEKIILSLDSMYDLLTAVEKIGNVTDLPMDTTGGRLMEELPNTYRGYALMLRDVSFSYPGKSEPTLRNVTMEIPSGARVGIFGIPGSGKTTLLALLTGLYYEFKGHFSINGLSLRDLNITSIRDSIGENMAGEDIFDGTLEENITMGKGGIGLKQVMWAIETAGLGDLVQQLPDGLQTHMIATGHDLSDSIRRKIIFARSIVEGPKLLVFDDSVLDADPDLTERALQLSADWKTTCTTIMVSRNSEVLYACDTVLVLRNGSIIAKGAWTDLQHQYST